MRRQYGVDVSAYQYANLSRYVRADAKFVIVKATEGLNYNNPLAASQIRSAHHNHIFVHAYHFATFSNSVHKAKLEAKHFIARCRYLNISKKRYLALDWETGDGNIVGRSKTSNTKAIIAFMSAIKKAGWKPMLYSGTSLLLNNIDTAKVIKKFGKCLWVASYPTMKPQWKANFAYFPSMDGVAIWQFSSNWCDMNIDGNVWLTDDKPIKQEKHPHEKTSVVCAIDKQHPTWYISLRDKNGHATGKFIAPNTTWKVFGSKLIHGIKYYKLGTDKQWVPAKFLRKK